MNKGVLIYAHNSKEVDYLDLAIVSGTLAKKNLNVPVSLVTDQDSIAWAEKSNKIDHINSVFENIIFSEDYKNWYFRKLYDGVDHSTDVPFLNKDRCSAWYLTPYDRTLLVDSDFLIYSDTLSNYWDLSSDFLIAESANDIFTESRFQYNDRFISEVGIRMHWATTIMFTKNYNSKIIFDLVEFIRDNYSYFSDLYRFDGRTYRNDIAFSIALHIINGNKKSLDYFLPPVASSIDKDVLIDVKKDKLFFLLAANDSRNYTLCSKEKTDIHIMNKQSIVRNKLKILGI